MTIVVVLWLAAVPSWISLSTFFWLNAAAMAIAAVFVAAVRSASPTRSIAHVIYDTEQATRSRR
jgi:hypothetical protein